ncbi:hypothetical protein EB796_017243 [Bugula neritina]|uniref:Cyclin-dependent kinase inhibitor domain-containing protein n=1 Tax=Bugula neritina TaxID=10212 RepID=A0A7J7JDZ7_BUGNE|nr:hypothetical protein EB796_017243 [Bugula neritina]
MLNTMPVNPAIDYRALVDAKSSPVKRCLFGIPDRAEVRAELLKHMANLSKESREKYNFDFDKGQPLFSAESRYQWEMIPESQPVPPPCLPPLSTSTSAKVEDSEIQLVPSPTASPPQITILDNSRDRSVKRSSKFKKPNLRPQRQITDYYSHKKRPASPQLTKHFSKRSQSKKLRSSQ